VKIARWVTERLLPSLLCQCCGKLTAAGAPPGAHPGAISYGPGINAAAVLLSGYGNVPSERAARLIAILLGMPVSPGFVDRASARLDEKLQAAGFDDAMQAALADEPVLGADETPVNVLTRDADPETGEPEGGAARAERRAPGGKLTWPRAMGSRRAAAITAILPFFTGILITDGHTAYQQMLTDLTGIQQCAAHVIRRCRAVSKLGPGSLRSWATDVIIILRQAHLACEDARSRGQPPDPRGIADLRERYDEAVSFGTTHNRHRDWYDGNHPGYALGSWPHGYADQVAIHERLRRRVDEQRLRAGRQSRQTALGRVRVLAHPGHPRPLVPDSQLPRLRHRSRAHRPGLRQRRHGRRTLAPAAPRR
jgi:hypothetical protein